MRYLLAQGEIITLQNGDAIESLSLLAGAIWLTRSSDTRDYCLQEGTRLAVVRGETLIIEALTPATLTVNCRLRRAGVHITTAWPHTSPRTA
ncbi:DUF2917 domain-containing protein [Geomonas subterranea]|uniref:DUF2917 domain-containing protein n=1 Tax=Geomonas subterranea TaxID=2847989 RepID=A0ABX8LLV5_9BACT|nr:DUF2917 domain-containing protein [Geomonas subterranea]QXE91619.1 DUF2917 domain-containing protein [Geomonas subterranea]QXM10290.1 DUF2917 domain-containing protein [Geomonas subterranea]